MGYNYFFDQLLKFLCFFFHFCRYLKLIVSNRNFLDRVRQDNLTFCENGFKEKEE